MRGNIDQTTRISAKVRVKRFLNDFHSFPRNFLPTMWCAVLFIVTSLKGLSMHTLQKKEWTEFSWRHNVYNAKFSVESRLEHGFAIEYTCFQWL